MDRKIRVSSDLRARDVPPGTRVTPRGREYMLLGLFGGWIAGGVCMVTTYDKSNLVLWVIKIFAAATVGSLAGTLVSWVMPGTRARMKVIREMKVHIAQEREAEAEAVRQAVGQAPRVSSAMAGADAAVADDAPTSVLSYVDGGGAGEGASGFSAVDTDVRRVDGSRAEEPVSPASRVHETSSAGTAPTGGGRATSGAQAAASDDLADPSQGSRWRKTADTPPSGDASALLRVLGEYTSVEPDDPRA